MSDIHIQSYAQSKEGIPHVLSARTKIFCKWQGITSSVSTSGGRIPLLINSVVVFLIIRRVQKVPGQICWMHVPLWQWRISVRVDLTCSGIKPGKVDRMLCKDVCWNFPLILLESLRKLCRLFTGGDSLRNCLESLAEIF